MAKHTKNISFAEDSNHSVETLAIITTKKGASVVIQKLCARYNNGNVRMSYRAVYSDMIEGNTPWIPSLVITAPTGYYSDYLGFVRYCYNEM